MVEGNFHKIFLAGRAKKISREVLSKSVEKAKSDKSLPEKMARGKLKIVILADNKKEGIPKEFTIHIQRKIQELGFPCLLGTDYYTNIEECFEEDVEAEIGLNNLILLINGKKPALVGESKLARLVEKWKKKTLFFFQYGTYDELKAFAVKKQFPVDFKFPIPYKGRGELESKVLFGVLHWHYYKYRHEDSIYKEGVIENGQQS
ncbi:MAG: hypothetical protein AABW99_04400 [archaeon]